MKKMIIAAAAFVAMTGMAMAGPLSSTDELMGSAASGATQLSNTEMAGVSGTAYKDVSIITQRVTQIAVAVNTRNTSGDSAAIASNVARVSAANVSH